MWCDSDLETLDRIIAAVDPVLSNADNSIQALGNLLSETSSLGPIAPLLSELQFLDKWFVLVADESGQQMRLPQVWFYTYLVLAHMRRVVDREGWYSAKWYKDNYGIPPSRLRVASGRDKRLPKKKHGNTTVYPFAVARRLWPEDISH